MARSNHASLMVEGKALYWPNDLGKKREAIMGGFGSGNHRGAKQCVDECITLSASWLLQNHYFDLGVHQKKSHCFTWPNHLNQTLYGLTFDIERTAICEMRFHRRDREQVIFIVGTPMRFGGVRWWFKCSSCFHRRATLYLDRVTEKFLCRVCLDLTYSSCQQSHAFDSAHAELAAGMGNITGREVGRMIARAKRGHNKRPWVRKRDRRRNYRSRWICPMYPLCKHD